MAPTSPYFSPCPAVADQDFLALVVIAINAAQSGIAQWIRQFMDRQEDSMQRQWYLIDDEGIHPLDPGGENSDFWADFRNDDDAPPWPPFNQVALNATPTRVVDALLRTGPELGLELEDLSEVPERWNDALLVAPVDEISIVGEPGVDLDEAVLAIPWAEAIFADLRCDGAFFGYDDAAQTLHLTRFRDGRYDFSWSDSLSPGPSYAMVFDDSGECTNEDPRRFALRMLDMPETSPLLDRYGFVTTILGELGLQTIRPGLVDLPVTAALGVSMTVDG